MLSLIHDVVRNRELSIFFLRMNASSNLYSGRGTSVWRMNNHKISLLITRIVPNVLLSVGYNLVVKILLSIH